MIKYDGYQYRGCVINVKYVVELNTEEREALVVLTSKGKESARKLKRAQLLLLVDGGKRDKKIVDLLNISTEEAFHNGKKRATSGSWQMNATYIKVKDQWLYLYRAVDKFGDTIDFMLTEKRDEAAARRFFNKAVS